MPEGDGICDAEGVCARGEGGGGGCLVDDAELEFKEELGNGGIARENDGRGGRLLGRGVEGGGREEDAGIGVCVINPMGQAVSR